ncbi:MAG TPA: aldose epimerase family protein [Terriglobales bacterium]|nr:aldose epimerase family protein [Terriglobales bacterium]
MFGKDAPGKVAILFGLMLCAPALQAATQVTKAFFGKTPDGTAVDIYTLTEGKFEARIMTYGGIVVSLRVPDREGTSDDVVLGYDSLDGYIANNSPYFGALIGRYGNRIAHGMFALAGKTYTLPKNDGDNTLHGGRRGFDKVVWSGQPIQDGVELTYVSPDGDQGFPGRLTAVVRYTLSRGALRIEYSATTDKNTVLNLTNHSYFNLAGQGNGDILGHQLQIFGSRFTPVDSTLIPSGDLRPVEKTPFDFRTSHAIGERINADDEQIRYGRGYDHNWVLDHAEGKLGQAAEVYEPSTKRALKVLTDQPGIQFYAGNFLDGTITGKGGKVYGKRYAFCLETQHFPDSPNHPNFPSTELKPGEKYHSVTVFEFGTATRE